MAADLKARPVKRACFIHTGGLLGLYAQEAALAPLLRRSSWPISWAEIVRPAVASTAWRLAPEAELKRKSSTEAMESSGVTTSSARMPVHVGR